MMAVSENIVLATLCRIDERIDRLVLDVQDINVRMGAVDKGLAGINRRLDGLDYRFERIEHRLDLSDVTH
jgi:archaellum component FlaC